MRQAFLAQFPDLFAPDYNATLHQAMFLSNSRLIDELLAPRPGNLTARLAALKEDRVRVREAFLAVYGREPEKEELASCVAYLGARPAEAGARQLVWALVTSAEFQLNH